MEGKLKAEWAEAVSAPPSAVDAEEEVDTKKGTPAAADGGAGDDSEDEEDEVGTGPDGRDAAAASGLGSGWT